MDLLRSMTLAMQEHAVVIWTASLASGLNGVSVLVSVTVSGRGHESFPSSPQALVSIVELMVMEAFCKCRDAILSCPKRMDCGWSHHQLVRKSLTLWTVFWATGACGGSAQLIVMVDTTKEKG